MFRKVEHLHCFKPLPESTQCTSQWRVELCSSQRLKDGRDYPWRNITYPLDALSWRNSREWKIKESLIPRGQGIWPGAGQPHEISDKIHTSITCGWSSPVPAYTYIISFATVKCAFLLIANWLCLGQCLFCFATQKILEQRPLLLCFRQTILWGAGEEHPCIWAALVFFRNLVSVLVNYSRTL